MLQVRPLNEALALTEIEFGSNRTGPEEVELRYALGRVLYGDLAAGEFVPGFDRSTVDGLAVRAADTFGCSDTMPAMLAYKGEIRMGTDNPGAIGPGECMGVSTGGMLPAGADAAVMVEHTEDYGDGFRYALKPVSPGENIVRKGDDVPPGKIVLKRSALISSKETGALAALGFTAVTVYQKPVAGILSTGDELVPVDEKPAGGQVRDVNAHLLAAAVREAGGEPLPLGIAGDDEASLAGAVKDALPKCDMLLISGGSSAGEKDLTARVIASQGRLLLHGLAMKPGKPTILGEIGGKPVFGLPGHPVAAFFVFQLLVRPLICSYTGTQPVCVTKRGILSVNIPSNHGREEIVPVKFLNDGSGEPSPCLVEPVPVKSGLITLLSEAEGYIKIPRDCEGLFKGAGVEVYLF